MEPIVNRPARSDRVVIDCPAVGCSMRFSVPAPRQGDWLEVMKKHIADKHARNAA